MRWLVAFGITVGLFGSPVVSGEPPRKIKPVLVLHGIDSGQSKESFACCRVEAEWKATWKAHQEEGGDADRYPPEVDFDSFMVVAIFHGDGSQNYGIDVEEVLEEAECLRIRYRVAYYQIAGLRTSEAEWRKLDTRSFAFAVLPRSSKALVFEYARHRHDDKTPIWEERGKAAAAARK